MQNLTDKLEMRSANAISILGKERFCFLYVNRGYFKDTGKKFIMIPKKQYPLFKLDELSLV